MTLALTTSEQELVRRMAQSEVKAEWGFELLLEQRSSDLAKFFNPLESAGLFNPEKNSGPIPSDKEGFVHIPLWPALKYLEAVAKHAGDANDLELSNKVMQVVRSVSQFRDQDGNLRDNYHTFRIFAEILGLLPLETVTLNDIDLIPAWLSSRYDRGLVASTLDKGYMSKALSTELPGEWEKACKVLYHCTAIRWEVERGFQDRGNLKPVSVVDDYWLDKFIKHHVEALGKKVGEKASNIFAERLSGVFDPEKSVPSHWSRPTIEESDQNSPIEEPGDRFVEGLRDVLLHWVDHNPVSARDYVRSMLSGDTDIIRRIAIHTLNHRWAELRELYLPAVSSDLFCDEHLHELYQLLNSHFGSFSEQEKAKTLEAIRNIPPSEGEDRERWLKRNQRNWLSAIVNQGYEPVDQWYRELEADPEIGRLFKYPSLHSYHESWSGPGPSPYSTQQLVQHARQGTLVDALHAFTEPDGFQGPETPTTRALVDILSEAVKQHAEIFVEILPTFSHAKRPFQYGVINGLMHLWNDTGKNREQQVDWDRAWIALIEFFSSLLNDRGFWEEEVVEDQNMTPNRDWIPPLIASFLKAGTQSDQHAYPESLLPKTWQLINLLLENVQPNEDVGDDPMFTAINSGKGKAIEALFNHALRACRVSDIATGQHADAWEKMKQTFERELELCKNGNYEMSTLCGNYIANLDYLSHEWLVLNVKRIFPESCQQNFICAIDGLAYAPDHKPIYMLLIGNEVIDKALRLDLKGRHSREKLIQRIALAYLWGDEDLNGPRFSFFFESKTGSDLEEAGDFMWSISNQQLDINQVEKILNFWSRCVEWSKIQDNPPAALLSSLSKLACYVKTIGEREKELLISVAPYVYVGHDADRFIEELDRLADDHPQETREILGKVLETYKPVFDYQDRLKSLIKKIAAQGGNEKQAALKYVDELMKLRLRGMYELSKELQDA
jgi:hypothetical protein